MPARIAPNLARVPQLLSDTFQLSKQVSASWPLRQMPLQIFYLPITLHHLSDGDVEASCMSFRFTNLDILFVGSAGEKEERLLQ